MKREPPERPLHLTVGVNRPPLDAVETPFGSSALAVSESPPANCIDQNGTRPPQRSRRECTSAHHEIVQAPSASALDGRGAKASSEEEVLRIGGSSSAAALPAALPAELATSLAAAARDAPAEPSAEADQHPLSG